jgi:hypothetical protein
VTFAILVVLAVIFWVSRKLDLCRSASAKLGEQMGIRDLKESMCPSRPPTASTPFRQQGRPPVRGDNPDPETTSVAFSIPTFIDGASFIIGTGGPRDFKGLAGKKVGVLVNTTTEADLKRVPQAASINAEVISVKTQGEGIDAVQKGSVDAYYGDRGVLTFLLIDDGPRAGLLLADAYLSVEPMRWRLGAVMSLAVDRVLSQVYRSGEIVKLFATSFGATVQPSQLLQGLYLTSALPL